MNLRFKTWGVKSPLATLLFSHFLLMPFFCDLLLEMGQASPFSYSYFTPTAASFVALSALSFPSTLLWPGIHLIEMSCPR